jgi:hypothetical protein
MIAAVQQKSRGVLPLKMAVVKEFVAAQQR